MENDPVAPHFNVGENVRIGNSGKIGTINEVITRDNSVGYRVTAEGITTTVQEKYLYRIVDEETEILQSFRAGVSGDADDFHLFQTWFRLKRPVEGSFYSYLASKTIFNPYQFKPLSKFISPGSEGRLFIADEVGVGKTIETGIILIELLARGRIDRKSPVLIVCPRSLGPKWVREMRQRFNLQFHLHDSRSLKNFLLFAKDGIVPDGMAWSIVSLPLLRTEMHFTTLQEMDTSRELPLWSLVVIDESHHMRNSSTLSYQIGRTLSNLTEMLVMLSATPLNLRDEDLFNQMHILNSALFPDLQTFNAILSPLKSINRCRHLLTERTKHANTQILMELLGLKTGPLGEAISNHPGTKNLEKRLLQGEILSPEEIASYDRTLNGLSPLDSSFTRTLKREAFEHRVIREPIKIPVELSPEEMRFQDEVIELTRDLYIEKGGNPSVSGFITNIPRRMASSCIPAMREYLQWCIDSNSMLTGYAVNEDDPDDDLGLEKSALSPELKERFIQLRDDAEKIKDIDTKFENFLLYVNNLQNTLNNPQIIVFSFFIRTLKYLEQRLRDEGCRVGLIYGDTPDTPDGTNPSRYQIMDAFERGEYDILLSSEIGGEGLDFQFCQAIINYDLPYNPMRIEQRIGRIDRFGQKEDKVFIASMYIRNSVDEQIYNALYERIDLIQESIGTLEPILGTDLADLQNDIIRGSLSEAQLQERIRAVEIAVEQAKFEMDRFEQNRMELMGEDHFARIIQNLDARTEFVQPIDALWLTQRCLASWEDCNFRQIDGDSGYITLSRPIITKLEQYCRKPGSEGSLEELSRLLEEKFPLEVVFNGTIATGRASALFLSPCGFWIKFLLHELEQHEKIHRVFTLSGESGNIGVEPGMYIVPFYEVVLEGFTTEISLAAVPVDMKTELCSPCDYRAFSRILARNAVSSQNLTAFPDHDSLIHTAQMSLESQMEKEMAELSAENAFRIQSRINSIERATASQIDLLNKRLHDHYVKRIREGREPGEKFVRLIESQKENAKRRGEGKIRQFKDRDELVMTMRLVGIASLQVT